MDLRLLLSRLPYRKIALALIALLLVLSWLAPKPAVEAAPSEPAIVFMWT